MPSIREYTVISMAGEGSYGVVLKCKNDNTGEIVAIKQFKGPEDETTVREMKLLKIMEHKNIVKMKTSFRERGRLHLVFEYVEKNLLDLLEMSPTGLSPDLVKMYINQLCLGVECCHEHNVIHRDIKPENLLVHPNRRTGDSLKLCDFGVARSVGHPGQQMTDYVATRWYRAPELLLGQTSYSRPVDVWAIGCIMAEIINGQPLFPGASDVDQLDIIQRLIGPITENQFRTLTRNGRAPKTKSRYGNAKKSLQKIYHGLVTPDTIDFMVFLLQMDPSKRPTATDALNHPYLAGKKRPMSASSSVASEVEEEDDELFNDSSSFVEETKESIFLNPDEVDYADDFEADDIATPHINKKNQKSHNKAANLSTEVFEADIIRDEIIPNMSTTSSPTTNLMKETLHPLKHPLKQPLKLEVISKQKQMTNDSMWKNSESKFMSPIKKSEQNETVMAFGNKRIIEDSARIRSVKYGHYETKNDNRIISASDRNSNHHTKKRTKEYSTPRMKIKPSPRKYNYKAYHNTNNIKTLAGLKPIAPSPKKASRGEYGQYNGTYSHRNSKYHNPLETNNDLLSIHNTRVKYHSKKKSSHHTADDSSGKRRRKHEDKNHNNRGGYRHNYEASAKLNSVYGASLTSGIDLLGRDSSGRNKYDYHSRMIAKHRGGGNYKYSHDKKSRKYKSSSSNKNGGEDYNNRSAYNSSKYNRKPSSHTSSTMKAPPRRDNNHLPLIDGRRNKGTVGGGMNKTSSGIIISPWTEFHQ